MSRTRNVVVVGWLVTGALLVPVSALPAASHLWRINEVFSNADGTVQFIELHECCGAAREIFLQGLEFTSRATGAVFTFPERLTPPSANRFLLLATDAFAALPGAPEPDYVIPVGFVGTSGDTLWYSEARNYDSFVFSPGDLPTDGIASIHVENFATDEFTTGANSPTNYRGETGTVDAGGRDLRRGDCNDDGENDISDAVFLLGTLFLEPRERPCDDSCDANDDGSIDISDAVAMLLALFVDPRPLPAPVDCSTDPTADDLSCPSFRSCL